MKIIIDFDSTISKTHHAVLSLYREMTGDYGTEVDDNNLVWNMGDVCRLWTKEQVDEVFVNPRFFNYVEPFENCFTVLNALHKDGNYLEVCSLHKIGEGAIAKRRWIEGNMPFIDKITILPLEDGFGHFDKSSVQGDIIIDDRVDCILSSPCKYKILFGDYTWNRDFDTKSIPNCFRAKDWRDVLFLILALQVWRD